MHGNSRDKGRKNKKIKNKNVLTRNAWRPLFKGAFVFGFLFIYFFFYCLLFYFYFFFFDSGLDLFHWQFVFIVLVRGILVAFEYVLDADARVRLPLRLVERVVGPERLHLRLASLRLHRPSSHLQRLSHLLAHRQLSAQHRRATCIHAHTRTRYNRRVE